MALRENLEALRRIFLGNAHKESDEEFYLNQDEFISAICPSLQASSLTADHYKLLFRVADKQQHGQLTMNDFLSFAQTISKPDAEYEVAFRLFDPHGTGYITYENFKTLMGSFLASPDNDPDVPSFDFDCNWLTFYLGPKKNRRKVGYREFSQMLKGFQGEWVRQQFRHYDKEGTGFITADQFAKTVTRSTRHKLHSNVITLLPTIVDLDVDPNITYAKNTSGLVSYPVTRAFHNVVRQLDSVETIVRQAIDESSDGKLSKEDFQKVAARNAKFGVVFSPLEVDIIFHFASRSALGLKEVLGPGGEGLTVPGKRKRLTLDDFELVLTPGWEKPLADDIQSEDEPSATPETPKPAKEYSFGWQLGHQVYNFALGSVAGAFGATVVYPIDLVKTRMQNQRSATVGELLYRNSWDCFKKVIRNEGVLGLYRGLAPQLVGVAPEKAIKLTMNDLVRSKFRDPKTGSIKLWQEVVAGCTAGGCQVVFTNPLEIVKIRLQVQGEMIKNLEGQPMPRRGAMLIVRELGLLGLYKGAGACLLRDIPFSGIYFTAYSHIKTGIFNEGLEGKKLGMGELLLAGALAGMPAAYLATPADVIKTRLQVEARKGETQYKNIRHAFKTILKEEGVTAFFKGGAARVLRSSPQFGTTLMVYELLQGAIPFDGIKGWLSGERKKVEEKRVGESQVAQGLAARSRNALKMLLEVDYRFGGISTLPPPPPPPPSPMNAAPQ